MDRCPWWFAWQHRRRRRIDREGMWVALRKVADQRHPDDEEAAALLARPNRLLLFPAALFHSRALPENYGTDDTARLIQVVFGTGAWPRDTLEHLLHEKETQTS